MPKKVTRKPSTTGPSTFLDDAKHARLAPSVFKNYEVCPSYVPSEESTKAGERGSYLHKVMEGKAKRDEVWEERDDEHLKLIEDYVRPYEQKAKQDKLKMLHEHQFDLRALNIDGCDRGTGDLLILGRQGRLIDLFDWKFGWWEVDDAEVNIQIGIYVIGTFFEFPWADFVRVHILQPARDEVSEHTFMRKDIEAILLRARTIADRVNALKDKEFNPTHDNCLWCDNKANCQALHTFALMINYQAKLNLPFSDLNPEDFNDMENAGAIYDAANVIEKWCGSIKYKITSLAQEGAEIADHTLREVSGKRIFVDVEGAYELLNEDFNVSLSEFLSASDPSVTKLMDVVSKKAPKGKMGVQAKLASAALLAAGALSSTRPSAYLVRNKEKKTTKQDG